MLSNNENRRSLVDVGQTHLAPLGNRSCTDILIVGGDVARYAEASLRTARGENLLCQLGVAVGCFDKELRLVLARSSTLQSFDCACAVGLLDGEIAIEGKRLSAQSRCHHRHNNR